MAPQKEKSLIAYSQGLSSGLSLIKDQFVSSRDTERLFLSQVQTAEDRIKRIEKTLTYTNKYRNEFLKSIEL